MIIQIKYMALFYDNYQGGSGKPFKHSIMREISGSALVKEIPIYAQKEVDEICRHEQFIGDGRVIKIIIKSV